MCAVDNQGCGIAHYAASVGNMDVLRILKSRGYALTKLDNRGMQPLHRCARSDQGDVVSFLVQEGNDPFLKAEGKTPRDMVRHASCCVGSVVVLQCNAGCCANHSTEGIATSSHAFRCIWGRPLVVFFLARVTGS